MKRLSFLLRRQPSRPAGAGLSLATATALLAIGCGPSTLEAGRPSLAGATQIAALDPTPRSRITLSARGGATAAAHTVELAIDAVDLRVRSGAQPVVESLDLALHDTDVSAEALPPTGLKLRNLHLYVEHATPAQVRIAEPDRLELSAEAPLVLKWALLLDDGTVWPLGPTRTVPLALDVRAVRNGAATTLTLEARCAGTCWSIDGVTRLDDGVVTLETTAEVNAE